MTLSWRARRRWSLIVLLVALPLYVVAAVTIMTALDRPPILVELLVYVLLGIAWALPLRFVFRGIGRPEKAPRPPVEAAAPSPPIEGAAGGTVEQASG